MPRSPAVRLTWVHEPESEDWEKVDSVRCGLRITCGDPGHPIGLNGFEDDEGHGGAYFTMFLNIHDGDGDDIPICEDCAGWLETLGVELPTP